VRAGERCAASTASGQRRPLPIIAAEYGITRSQARDRVHRARVLGILAHAKPGTVSARPGREFQQKPTKED